MRRTGTTNVEILFLSYTRFCCFESQLFVKAFVKKQTLFPQMYVSYHEASIRGLVVFTTINAGPHHTYPHGFLART